MSETTTPQRRHTDEIELDISIILHKNFGWDGIHHTIANTDAAKRLVEDYRALSRASAPVSQKVRDALESITEECSIGNRPSSELLSRCREALTLLAPDTRTEYDKAVEALAPHLNPAFGWATCDSYGAIHLFVDEPSISLGGMGSEAWRNKDGGVGFLVTDIMRREHSHWRASLRQIKSGKVVPHV